MSYYELEKAIKSPPKTARYAGLFLVLALCAGLGLAYQRTVTFSYSGQKCFRDISVLPQLLNFNGEGAYGLAHTNVLKVGDYPLLSTKTCVSALSPPAENQAQKINLSILGIPLPNKNFKVVADNYPELDASNLGQKISVREPLIFKLNKTDKTFEYKMSAGVVGSDCQTTSELVICETATLGLKHNSAYEFKVDRYYKNQTAGEATTVSVTTVEPVEIVKSSPASGELVNYKPSEIVLSANKKLSSAKAELKLVGPAGVGQNVEHELKLSGNEIKLILTSPLARSATYEVLLSDAVAEDKGVLFQPYRFGFTASGGPKVLGVNVGGSSVAPGTTVVITFDQALNESQDIGQIVKSGPSSKIEIKGNKIYIKNATNLPLCAKFSISLSNSLANTHGISGNSAYSLNSRLRCYTTSVIGYSSQGRTITAWRFGSGAIKFVYFGTTHGNEKSTKYLLDRWISELDGNFDKIPASASVFVIPNINPDGFNANSRRNARGVDLNRNFPANDWKKDVTMPSGELVINGAGTAPLSEPESQAIASFVQAQAPRLIMTYHSVASIVSGNSVGIADGAASAYSDLSGYNYSAFGEEETVFKYDTTGAFETWLNNKIGIPSVLVELGSHSNSEFSKNRSAMWKMLSQ